ncbi:putative SMP-30/Gluconolaconase/LRE-like region [Trypanosoma cruzi]|nr:putative SMP-30/Gluconolaconase/LRE-like region [Trypanosoma cruzi]
MYVCVFFFDVKKNSNNKKVPVKESSSLPASGTVEGRGCKHNSSEYHFIMELVAELPGRLLTGLALDANDDVFAVCACSGELLRLNKTNGTMIPIMATETSPHALAIDPRNGDVYLTDRSENAILKLEAVPNAKGHAEKDEKCDNDRAEVDYTVVRYLNSFENRQFVGPTALAVAPDGELFFTDAGAEGDSSFADPVGAIFRTLQGHSQVVPLCRRGLIRPTGIAVTSDQSVYVCEQGTNRVLRFLLRGTYYIGSVFAQLQGGMGPSAIAVRKSDGSIFVTQYDMKGSSSSSSPNEGAGGIITVIGKDGEVSGIVRTTCPSLCAIALDSREETIYAVEADEDSGGSRLLRFRLSPAAQRATE